MTSYTISEINNVLKGELINDTNQKLIGPEEIHKAQNNQITFIGSKKYLKY